jgi:hypothetical protein
MQSTVIAAERVFIANYYGNHSAKFPKFCLASQRCCQARLIASRLHLPRRTRRGFSDAATGLAVLR